MSMLCASLIANKCTVQVNSTSLAAVQLKAGSFKSGNNCFVGGSFVGNPDGLSPQPEKSCDAIDDPFKKYSITTPPTCTYTDINLSDSGTAVLSPGTYCGGLTVNAQNISFRPGIYYITGGSLDLTAAADITGDGVSFVISETSTAFAIEANSIWLKASNTSPAAGFIFFSKRHRRFDSTDNQEKGEKEQK